MSKLKVFKLYLSQVSRKSAAVPTTAAATVSVPVELTSGPEYDAVIRETAVYSITPRTFVQRTLKQETSAASRFEDEYSHGRTTVVRFGIDPHSPDVQAEITSCNARAQKPSDVKSVASTKIPRDTEIQTYRDEAKKQLTQVEKTNVAEAIAHLNKGPGKTALVDVFVRDDAGKIDPTNPEIHTVLLFAQADVTTGQSKYLVIDPSNSCFSHILAGGNDDIRVCFNKKFQIYKPFGAAGPNPDQWRDCIDIAVKLAFSIEVNAKLFPTMRIDVQELASNIGEIDPTSLSASFAVREITNSKAMNDKLPKLVESYPVRVKQSSNVAEEKQTTSVLASMRHAVEELKSMIQSMGLSHVQLRYHEDMEQLLARNPDQSEYGAFIGECRSYTDRVLRMTDATTLLGMEMAAIDSLTQGVI
ncbi:MAG: hypothetical protein V4485_05600 [Pseudomonadota bacterium]